MNKPSLKIDKSTLTQRVEETLKERILNGAMAAGDRIWAQDIADELGISIAPVKEALLILQGCGLITNLPRRGAVVRTFSLKDMQELYDVRSIIEIESIKRLFGQGKIEETLINALETTNEKIGRQRQDGEFIDQSIAFEEDRKFHEILVNACNHTLLISWYTRLNTQAQIIRCSSWNIGPRGDKTYEEHKAIIHGLKQQDFTLTEKAIHSHLQSILLDFEQALLKTGGNIDTPFHWSTSKTDGRR